MKKLFFIALMTAGSSLLAETTAPVTTTTTTTTTDKSAVPASTQTTTTTAPKPATGTSGTAGAAPAKASVIAVDCNYKIPADTSAIDPNLILKWAEKATQQAFDFDFTKMDDQLNVLKICFTDQGWQSFNTALQKSGNTDAIKQQKLVVSSMVDGNSAISPVKDNQWKVTIPLQVVYQNEKEKLTQVLVVDLIIGRKVSGDLGIVQLIATPREAAAKQSTATPKTNK